MEIKILHYQSSLKNIIDYHLLYTVSICLKERLRVRRSVLIEIKATSTELISRMPAITFTERSIMVIIFKHTVRDYYRLCNVQRLQYSEQY